MRRVVAARPRRFRAPLLAGLFLAFPAQGQDQDDGLASEVEERCALGAGHNAQLLTQVTKPSCGNESCGWDQTSTLSLEGMTLLRVHVSLGDADLGPEVQVTCQGGLVRVTATADAGVAALELGWDQKAEYLAVTAGTRDGIERAWRAPPTTDANEAKRRVLLRELLLDVDMPESEVPLGLRELSPAVDLLVARDALATGAWERAEPVMPAPLGKTVPRLEPRRKRLAGRIESLRKRTQPLRLIGKRAIGTTLTVQKLPLDVSEQATLFWQGEELCVIAEETARGTMRCYSPARERWGAPQPAWTPQSGAHRLVGLDFPHVTRCMTPYVTQASVPPGPTPCDGGPGEPLAELVGVVDRDAMVLEASPGFMLNRAPDRNEALTVRAANGVLRRSAGTFVVGDGCCRFLGNGMLRRLGESDDRAWDVLGAAPEGEAWLSPPLVSPDQRWIVAQSGNGRGPRPITLWLFKVSSAFMTAQ